MALLCHQLGNLLVEGDEAVSAEPCSFTGDHAAGKTTAGFEGDEARFHGGAVHHDIARVEKTVDRLRDFVPRQCRAPAQDPDQFAQVRQADSDQSCSRRSSAAAAPCCG